MARDRTCTTFNPGRMLSGSCAEICPGEVCRSGIATLSTSTQEPPRTVGGGNVAAVALEARLDPVIVRNDPGWKLVDPAALFTIPPPAICGCDAELAGLVARSLARKVAQQ